MAINIKTQATLRGLGKARAGHSVKLNAGLLACAKIAADESQILVPKDTHALEKSMSIVSSGKGFGATAKIIYASPYAWAVHEDPSKSHAPPTTYKYLTKALAKRRGTMTAKLRRQLGIKAEGV